MLLDIAATNEGRPPDLELVRDLAAGCFMPLTVGGGVNSMEHIQELLDAGADKVVMNTTLFHTDTFERAAKRYGCQALVASIDVRQDRVWSNSGTLCQRMNPRSYARLCEEWGAGEILLTSIEREGTLEGYDLKLISDVSEEVGIPVIANGGCGTYEHMRCAIDAGASAVAAGAMFQFTDATPQGAAQYLQEQGIEVRMRGGA